MAETERFQVAGSGSDVVLVDSATGRSWKVVSSQWRPITFMADAPVAPKPARARAEAKLARPRRPAPR